MGRYQFVFPRWTNLILPAALLVGPLVPLYVVYVWAFAFSPSTTDIGYAPEQPVKYSHALHAGELGIDCRYCHNTVEHAAHAAVPPTQTCMNCHTQIHATSPQLEEVRQSYETGEPIQWARIHDLPDYSYFNHAAHVTRGVSCVECHGRVDRMEVVYQAEELSMGWCLDCHRNPDPHIRDPQEVTNLGWSFEDDASAQSRFDSAADYHSFWRRHNNLNPNEDCSTCHR